MKIPISTRIFISVFAWMFVIISCSNSSDVSVNKETPTVNGSSIIIPATITPTSTLANTTPEVSKPTETINSSTDTPNPRFANIINIPPGITDGSLWIDFEDSDAYLVYDLTARTCRFVNKQPKGCYQIPFEKSLDVFCRTDDRGFLYNLISEEESELNIPKEALIWYEPSIPNLLFYFMEPSSTDSRDYYAYDLLTGETNFLITTEHGGWATVPKFSPTGEFALISTQYNIIEKINLKTGETEPIFIGDENEKFTFNAEWSPTLPYLVFGVSTIEQEIGRNANRIYLWNYQTDAIVQLVDIQDPSIVFDEAGWPYWSPTGEEFLANASNGIWIIKVTGESYVIESPNLKESNENYWAGDITWSPDGNELAFREFPDGTDKLANLLMYVKETNELITVIQNERISNFFWR